MTGCKLTTGYLLTLFEFVSLSWFSLLPLSDVMGR
jgi:hypothetical protein